MTNLNFSIRIACGCGFSGIGSDKLNGMYVACLNRRLRVSPMIVELLSFAGPSFDVLLLKRPSWHVSTRVNSTGGRKYGMFVAESSLKYNNRTKFEYTLLLSITKLTVTSQVVESNWAQCHRKCRLFD